MEEILRTILYEWLERKLPSTIEREQKLEFEINKRVKKAVVVTGFRRAGKTYFLFHHIKKLLEKYSRKEVVYINFEDERIPQETAFLSALLPTIKAVFGQMPKFLFLDELQNIPSWSKWLRRVLESYEIQLFVTGSSSKMSSYELPSELRGRCFEIRINPLNLKEFFRFKNFSFDKEKLKYLPQTKADFNFLFDEYLYWGGLPEVVLLPSEKKQEALQGYFETVVKKEMIDRFKIKNETALKTLLKLLINSSYISISKLFNSLKSLGIAVGKTTLSEYLSYIESSYFLKQLYFYSPSMLNQLQYPRKVYFVDNGFISALSTRFSKNFSRLWENLVFWWLKSSNKEIYYYQDRNKNEVDFVGFKDGKVVSLYQACYSLTDFETKEREIKALKKASRRLNCKNVFFVARNIDEKITKDLNYPLLTPIDFL
jgi:predicted AAA+ superfamily ATPase